MSDPIEDFITRAQIDDDDRDIGTSGLCGTFALALYQVLQRAGLNPELCILCVADQNGQPEYVMEKGKKVLHWRHFVVRVSGNLYDVDGKVLFADIVSNYCWGSKTRKGILIPVSFKQGSDIVRQMRHRSYDGRRHADWKSRLSR